MNTIHLKKTNFLVLFVCFVFSLTSYAQLAGWKPELEKDAKEALSKMISDAPKLQTFKDQAYGYAVYPKITKAGLVIGGAGGEGVVYKGGAFYLKIKQHMISLQEVSLNLAVRPLQLLFPLVLPLMSLIRMELPFLPG
jgi:hypothetical protein